MGRPFLLGWALTVPHFLETLGSFSELLAEGIGEMRKACLRVQAAARRWRKEGQGMEDCGSLTPWEGDKCNRGEGSAAPAV